MFSQLTQLLDKNSQHQSSGTHNRKQVTSEVQSEDESRKDSSRISLHESNEPQTQKASQSKQLSPVKALSFPQFKIPQQITQPLKFNTNAPVLKFGQPQKLAQVEETKETVDIEVRSNKKSEVDIEKNSVSKVIEKP